MSHPAHDYEEALARFEQIRTREETDPHIRPICRSVLLTHGKQVDSVFVLMHGMTNCPHQYAQLAPLLFEQGHNVLIPRMPHNGFVDRDTKALKYLTAEELRDSSSEMIDLAHGLGKHITFAGISAGGTMAAWAAQNRADVDRAVLIAPAFTFSRRAGVEVTRLAMHLFDSLPNLMTQRVMPIKEGPFYNYFGFATHGLGQMIRLGLAVYDAAGREAPVAPSVVVITNAADPAVNNAITHRLARRWRAYGEARVTSYEFAATYDLIHDIIDPLQKQQQTALVYPTLLKLLAPEQQTALPVN
jgi:pimeloyl-ACP methyl ester carboxylesterase